MMGKHGRRRALSMVCVGAMTVLMADCGQKTTAKGEKKVEISMLGFLTPGEGVTKAMKPLMEQYLAKRPNIVLDEESVSNAGLAIKVQTLVAGDELPDVFVLKGQMTQTFVENGKLYALDDVPDADAEWKDNFKEGVFSNSTISEKTYALSFQVTNICVFYNMELLAQAGITEFPKTWDELIGTIPDLKTLGVTPIVPENKEKWDAESIIMSTPGNKVTGDDWYQSIRDNSGAKFTDPEFVAPLQALSDLTGAEALNEDVNSTDGAQQRQMYMNGKAAITIDGGWAIASFDENCPDEAEDVIEMAAPPMAEGSEGDPEAITGGAGWATAVSAKITPEKPAIAMDMLKATIGPAYGTAAIKEGTLAAVKPGENVEITSTIAARSDQFAEGRLLTPAYDHQLNSGVIDVMQGGLQELLIGRVTPEELAQRVQTEYENNGK